MGEVSFDGCVLDMVVVYIMKGYLLGCCTRV
jgi:hypothetical protein